MQVGRHGEALGAAGLGDRDAASVVQGAQIAAEAGENTGQQRQRQREQQRVFLGDDIVEAQRQHNGCPAREDGAQQRRPW
ncbi:hypothetical protein [Streptomyces sp. NPDC007929]|uniref:hypothetical protein n=1 Tax=unclassified Streptomyces TaxID=2593676 RepID=UPI0036E0C85A